MTCTYLYPLVWSWGIYFGTELLPKPPKGGCKADPFKNESYTSLHDP
jgi:hypothetical protein